jgi:hypothetical protein
MHPAGLGDEQHWYAVIVGREPGIYRSAYVHPLHVEQLSPSSSRAEADQQVLGVPGQYRQKKASRREALVFYATKYQEGLVAKWTEATVGAAAPAPVATTTTARTPEATVGGAGAPAPVATTTTTRTLHLNAQSVRRISRFSAL